MAFERLDWNVVLRLLHRDKVFFHAQIDTALFWVWERHRLRRRVMHTCHVELSCGRIHFYVHAIAV